MDGVLKLNEVQPSETTSLYRLAGSLEAFFEAIQNPCQCGLSELEKGRHVEWPYLTSSQ